MNVFDKLAGAYHYTGGMTMKKTPKMSRLLTAMLTLCILFAGMAFAAEPAMAATTPSYIASIGVAQDGSSGSTGINDCKNELSGHIIIDRDLNDGAGGDYVYMGYKTTTDPSKAITGILFRVGGNPPHSITHNNYTFNLVGGNYEANTAKLGGWIDLNARARGVYIYTYVTRDKSYGPPLTELMVSGSSSVSGYYPGLNTSGSTMNLNQEAGGGALYLHYKYYLEPVQATYYYLTSAGARTDATISAKLWNHQETLTSTPYYSNSVTYDGRSFTFWGWREDNTAGSATVTPSVTVSTTPKTYRAVYSGSLTLSYNANGGSGAPSAQKATQYINAGSSSISKQSKSFTISSTKPTNADKCAFLGWSTSSSATSASYAPGGSITISSNTTLYAVWKDHSYTDNVCTDCGRINPAVTPVAHLSKNGEVVGAYTTLDAAVTAAEKCTAADKAVVQLQKDIALGDAYQDIEGGVFTLDLNGYTISCTSESRYALGLPNTGTNVVITSSRKGGTILSAYHGINASSDTALTVSDVAIIAEESGIMLGSSASISNVSIDAGVVGIWAWNSSTVTVTDCTIEAGVFALYIESKVTATVTGGSYTGGDKEEDIYVTGKATVSGAAFPGGIAVDGKPLSAILAEGQACWAGDTMIVLTAGQKKIAGRGDITVKAECKHESGTKQDYVNNGDDHNYAYSCCGAIYTEAHAYSAENGLCLCGHINPEAAASVSKNGAVVGAYTTLDEAINVAEGCTAEDKAVVQLQKDIDLGTRSQYIGSGVFTLDLNGYTITVAGMLNNTLGVYNSGTDVTIISSREGGTISSGGSDGILTDYKASITMSGITVKADDDGMKLNGKASISNVTIEAGNYGIRTVSDRIQITESTIDAGIVGIYVSNGGNLEATDCTVEAGLSAVYTYSGTSATITGGSMICIGNEFTDIDASGEVTVSGTTFPGGVKVTYKPLSDILAEGQAYWAGDRMIVPADGQTEITGMGDITVKAACTHENGTKLDYADNGEGHGFTYSCCSASYTEDHSYRAENGLCPCGHINPDAAVLVEGEQNAWFMTIADALAAWTDGTTMKLLGDVTHSATITIPAGESRTLDLNGQTWTSELQMSSLLNNQGALTITDTSSEKTGAIIQMTGGTRIVTSSGSLTIQGGRLQCEHNAVYLSECTATFSGGEIVSTRGIAVILSAASLTVSETACIESARTGVYVTGNSSLNVSGGTIRSLLEYAVDVGSNASAVISGGTISGEYGVYCEGKITLSAPAGITGSVADFHFPDIAPDARIIADFDMSGVQTPYVVEMDMPSEFAVKTERGTLSLQAFTEAEYNKSRNDKIVATETGLAMIPCQHGEGFDESGACLGCGGQFELPLIVEDVFVTSANCGDVLGDGTVRFDFATMTLYLNNARIEGDLYQGKAGIGCNDADIEMDLKIHLTGENTVSCKGYFGIYSEYDCIITGDGSLTVTGTGVGLSSFSDMTISAQVNVSCVDAFDGLFYGVYAQGDLTVTKGGRLTAQSALDESAMDASIYCEQGSISNYGTIILTGGVQTILQRRSGVCGADAVSPHRDGVCMICEDSHEGSSDAAMVTLPASLQVIEEEAFLGTAMQQVKVPEGTLRIEKRAFADSSLQVISLPDSVEFIADDAFEGCENLVIEAPEGSYAHIWALDQGYSIK